MHAEQQKHPGCQRCPIALTIRPMIGPPHPAHDSPFPRIPFSTPDNLPPFCALNTLFCPPAPFSPFWPGGGGRRFGSWDGADVCHKLCCLKEKLGMDTDIWGVEGDDMDVCCMDGEDAEICGEEGDDPDTAIRGGDEPDAAIRGGADALTTTRGGVELVTATLGGVAREPATLGGVALETAILGGDSCVLLDGTVLSPPLSQS